MDELGLDRDALVGLYRSMVVTRRLEETGHTLYKQGKIPGSFYTGRRHEAMNFAGARRLPVVFVCDNNQFAYSTPNHLEFGCERLVDRGPAYGFEGVSVDGTDVLAVYREAKQAIEKARAGGGPTLIESVTLRMEGHAVHDDAARADVLRPDEEHDVVHVPEGVGQHQILQLAVVDAAPAPPDEERPADLDLAAFGVVAVVAREPDRLAGLGVQDDQRAAGR